MTYPTKYLTYLTGFISFLSLTKGLEINSSVCLTTTENILISGNLYLTLLIPSCSNSETQTIDSPLSTYIESAKWVTQHINTLNYTHPFVLGLKQYNVCNEYDYQKVIFDTYSNQEKFKSLGLISFEKISEKNMNFGRILNVTIKKMEKLWFDLVKASVKVIEQMDWTQSIIIASEDKELVKEFNRLTRTEWICVKDIYQLGKNGNENVNKSDSILIIFGNSQYIQTMETTHRNSYSKLIIVPLDGSKWIKLPFNATIIQENHITKTLGFPSEFPETTLLLDISNTLLELVKSHIEENNNSLLIQNAINSSNEVPKIKDFQSLKIIEDLKLKPELHLFNYNVYLSESYFKNSSKRFTKTEQIFSYNIFKNELISSNPNTSLTNVSKHENMCALILDECLQNCVNFREKVIEKRAHKFSDIVLRSESWLFGFISVSVLGVIFSISTLAFFILSMFKRVIFEGNPTSTILLILSIISIYCSIIPFAISPGEESENTVCLYRTLSVSLSYAAAFSLLLSRSIILATISKELGYMSHASGPIQSFLCLFMFAVQCALCLQYFHNCQTLFNNNLLFLYSLSYNMILLVLFLCVSPMVFHSQRNYREGKYFAISALSTTMAWICWILGYIFLGPFWRDAMICLGLVSTGSIMVAVILIPRTYMMTVSATRNKITNALPSLRTSSSIMDIYKASTQPIYDCVNVAAINSNVALNGNDEKYYKPSTGSQFDGESTITTVQAEKTTKF